LSFLRSKRGLMLLAIAVVLGLFLIRPGAGRLRSRIAGAISTAVGREVEIGSVSVHLLPQPGFDLGNFVVHDDPAFSAEPMLRSDDVTAALRVGSLFRGRLEIARLSLTEPSVNLVRNSNGHWNLEDLLERAARTPIAPTTKATGEARPSFPYIEADRGRINVKFGLEKKPYALTNADFSFWQDSENAWGMRLKAQPVRTDFNLSDTGLLQINGIWQRAGTLRQTPVQFTLLWEGAQLGQLTKLVTGSDKGWRGEVSVSTTVSGTPGDLGVHTDASVEDFRRYDVLGGGSLRVAAKCDGRYHSADRRLSDLVCNAPSGDGNFSLNGSLGAAFGAADYRLAVSAQDVPAESLAAFFRHTKKDVPEDLVATGRLNAIVQMERGASGFAWSGAGQTVALRLQSQLANSTLALDSIPFAFASGTSSESNLSEVQRRKRITRLASPENRVDVGPFELPLAKTSTALVQGWVARSGYELRILGDAQVQRVLQVAHMFGVPAPRPAADGNAKLDLQLAGSWTGFATPQVTGKAQLQAVHAELRGMNAPLDIASASVVLAPDQVAVQNLVATAGNTTWRGSVMIPRLCGVPGTCLVRFDLHGDEISTDRLNQLLNPRMSKRPWYRFLSTDSQTGPPFFLRVHAAGKLSADRVTVRNLLATRVSANLTLENGKLTASDLRGDVLGGRHLGNWKADFLAKPPEYSGSGKLEHFTLDELSDAMHNNWITGMATASYQLKTAGLSAADLFSAADATLQVEAHDGSLPHIELGEQAGPLHMQHLGVRLLLHDNAFDIQDGKLETPDAIYQLSGTASLGQSIDLKLIRSGASGFSITGTFTRPRVAPTAPETEAVLKP